MIYDVIIIGAGPAGANAALSLSKFNLKTVLIEKERLPRFKPCGGAISATAMRHVEADFSNLAVNRPGILKVLDRNEYFARKKFFGSNAPFLVNRIDFDNFLLQEAQTRSGGRLLVLDSCEVESYEEDSDGVIVQTSRHFQVKGRYLIAADGALSVVARSSGLLKNRRYARSVGAEVITSRQYYQNHSDVMLIDLFCVPKGYGWVFPKEESHFTCGLGTWGESTGLKWEFQRFLKTFFPKNTIKKMTAYYFPIPIFQGTKKIATGRILFAGDAAALVDPVSGEGIRFALWSGKIAAEIIGEVLITDEPALKDVGNMYQRGVQKGMGDELRSRVFEHLAFMGKPAIFRRMFTMNFYI